jgi:hypothetical protein
MRLFSSTREMLDRIGLVFISQMISAMVHSVENPSEGIRTVSIADIKKYS